MHNYKTRGLERAHGETLGQWGVDSGRTFAIAAVSMTPSFVRPVLLAEEEEEQRSVKRRQSVSALQSWSSGPASGKEADLAANPASAMAQLCHDDTSSRSSNGYSDIQSVQADSKLLLPLSACYHMSCR